MRDLVVLTFDELAPSALGCYGNDWVETPHLDALAASGVIFDHCFARDLTPSCFPWAPEHSARKHTPPQASLPAAASQTQWVLLQEEESAVQFPVESRLPSPRYITGQAGVQAQPRDVPIARLIDAGVAWWREQAESASRHLWLHSAGVSLGRLPPEGFATLYFEDFLERGQDLAALPITEIATHPAVYGGHISLVDQALQALFDTLKQPQPRPITLIITAARGVDWLLDSDQRWPEPLRRQTEAAAPILEPIAHVPLLIAEFGAKQTLVPGHRVQQLVSAVGLLPFVRELSHEGESTNENASPSAWSQSLHSDSAAEVEGVVLTQRADRVRLRTPRYAADFTPPTTRPLPTENAEAVLAAHPTLFAKPEDYWDFNNLAGQLPGPLLSLWEQFLNLHFSK